MRVSSVVSPLSGACALFRPARLYLWTRAGRSLREYRRQCHPDGRAGAGDAFFKWMLTNRGNETRARLVPIHVTADGADFAEFPRDTALTAFDRDDRKFVAVALASSDSPPIVNATDTDWWLFREALARHGVTIEFLCPDLMRER